MPLPDPCKQSLDLMSTYRVHGWPFSMLRHTSVNHGITTMHPSLGCRVPFIFCGKTALTQSGIIGIVPPELEVPGAKSTHCIDGTFSKV